MLTILRPDGNVPIHVQIEVTWKCNWRCVHCYQDDHSIETLSLDCLSRLFDELASLGTMHIIITGGEPLVRKDIFDIIAAIRRNGMAITLYSNGHLIDDRMAGRLGSTVAEVEVSLLAGEEAVHDQLSRVRGSFQRTVRAVRALRERHVNVIVKTPILRPARPTLKALEKLTTQWGVQWLADPEITRSYAGESYPLQYQLGFEELQDFFREFPQFNPAHGRTSDPGVRNGLCLAGRQYSFIDAFGNVYPCLNFKSACDVLEARGESPAARLGNIRQSTFADIWKQNTFVNTIRAAKVEHFRTCASCGGNSVCSPCMALNYEEHGKLFQPAKAVCGMTKAATTLQTPGFVPASELRILS